GMLVLRIRGAGHRRPATAPRRMHGARVGREAARPRPDRRLPHRRRRRLVRDSIDRVHRQPPHALRQLRGPVGDAGGVARPPGSAGSCAGGSGRSRGMSDSTALGDRMKGYEQAHRAVLPRRTYTLLRLDGRAFHTYLRGADKPFDMPFITDMAAVSEALCEEISGTV